MWHQILTKHLYTVLVLVTRQQCLCFNICNQCNILACNCNIYNAWTNFRSLLYQHKEKSSYQCMSTNSFRSTDLQCVDLNPLDFYLWGHLKTIVYSAPIEIEGTLHQRISDAYMTIRDGLGTFEIVQLSVIRCIHACIESGRGYFEHLSWPRTSSTIKPWQLLIWKRLL